MDLRQWEITPNTITHHGKPAFIANWTSGDVNLEKISGVFWYDENIGNEDDRHLIYGFKWKSKRLRQPNLKTY